MRPTSERWRSPHGSSRPSKSRSRCVGSPTHPQRSTRVEEESDAEDQPVPVVQRPGRGGRQLLRRGVQQPPRHARGGEGTERGALRRCGTGQARNRDDRELRARRARVRRPERRPAVRVHRGDLLPRPVRNASGSRSPLGHVHEGGRRGEPVRVAEGQVRTLVADHPEPLDGTARRPRPWALTASDGSDAQDAEDRHRHVGACRRRRVGVRSTNGFEALLRDLAPQVLGALVRRYEQFDAAEDAVQEALVAASQRWPTDGVPEDPRAWLSTVASRRLVDEWRSESARRRREENVATLEAPVRQSDGPAEDDTLTLLFMCCHPSLSAPSQLALTLRAVGGLTTAEIANAFLVPEATMAQRISRAKQNIRGAGLRFDLPPESERAERLRVVMQMLHRLVPGETEVAGLLALMLLIDARRDARTDEDGMIVPLAEQRRDLWDP